MLHISAFYLPLNINYFYIYTRSMTTFIQKLNQFDNSNLSKLTTRAFRYGRTRPDYRRATLSITTFKWTSVNNNAKNYFVPFTQ